MSYLFLKKHSLAEWQELAKTTHQARYERLLDQANSYADYLPPPEHPSDSITYIGMAVANLGLAYLLSEDTKYLDIARNWIKVGIGYPSWGKERMPDHDLDAAWLLFGLSLGYDWLKKDLSEDERQALHDKLYLQGQRLYDFAVETEGSWWSSAYWQNHNWICYAGLATAAYALEDEHPETKTWSDRAAENFQIALPLMPDDGSDYEGPVYWRYGFIWFLIYADLLEQESGIDLHDSNFLAKTGDFRLYLSAPNLINTANFGDCHDRRSAHSAAINLRLASLYKLGHIQKLTDHFYDTGEWLREGKEGLVKPGVLPEAVLEFLWYNPSVEHAPLEDLSLVKAYPDLGLVSSRTSWQPDATYLMFKCGSPGGNKAWAAGQAYNRVNDWQTISVGHDHPDANGFILIKGEDYLAVDEGYSRAKFSKHHSTLLVDGQGQYKEGGYNAFRDLGPEWGGRLEAAFYSGSSSYMRGEAARCYEANLGLRQFTRQIIFEGDAVFFYDTVRADAAKQFDWQLQMDELPEQVSENRFGITAGESKMGIHVFEPQGFAHRYAEEEITANPTSAKPDWIIRRMQHALVLSPAEKTNETTFLVALNLADFDIEMLEARRGKVLKSTKEGKTLLIAFADGRDGIWSTNLESDASWLSASYADENVEKFLVGEVTNLWLDRKLYVSADFPIQVAYGQKGAKHIWKTQSTLPTFVSLKVPRDPKQLTLNGEAAEVQFNKDLSLMRLEIPAGESEIVCHV